MDSHRQVIGLDVIRFLAALGVSIALALTFLAMIALAAMITIYGEPLVRRAITGQADNYGAGRR